MKGTGALTGEFDGVFQSKQCDIVGDGTGRVLGMGNDFRDLLVGGRCAVVHRLI